MLIPSHNHETNKLLTFKNIFFNLNPFKILISYSFIRGVEREQGPKRIHLNIFSYQYIIHILGRKCYNQNYCYNIDYYTYYYILLLIILRFRGYRFKSCILHSFEFWTLTAINFIVIKGGGTKKFKHKIGEFNCPDCEYSAKRNDKLKLHIQTKHEGLRYWNQSFTFNLRRKLEI